MAPNNNRPRRPPTHQLNLFVEAATAKDAIKALLHTIFFQRLFSQVRPLTRDLVFLTPTHPSSTRIGVHKPRSAQQHPLSAATDSPTLTYPLVDDPDLESTVSDRATQLAKTLERVFARDPDAEASATVRVHFYEKKRKKATTGFAGFWKESGAVEGNGVCWESWDVRVVSRRAAAQTVGEEDDDNDGTSAVELVRDSVRSMEKATVDVVRLAGERDHIPPVTIIEVNPFPYEIVVEGIK